MSAVDATAPHRRLAAFYFAYFLAMGALVPYWSLYLQDRGLEPQAIGALVALMTLIKVISPNFWGAIADSRGWHLGVIRVSLCVAAVSFAAILIPGGFWWVALVMATYSFFWQGALPQFEALTLSHLSTSAAAYGRIRLWGSVGFIFAVMACGRFLDSAGAGQLPLLVLPLLFFTGLVSLWVPSAPLPRRRQQAASLGAALRRPAVIALLAACLLMQAAHGPFYVFFSIHLEDFGYSRERIGQLWALGVVAEIAVFVCMATLVSRFGLRRLFVLCAIAGCARWVIVAYLSDSVLWLALSQLLHAATFGIFHACGVQLVQRFFPGALQGRGQALYASIGYGVGGGFGSLASGYAWQHLGAHQTWLAASVVSAVAFLIAALWVREPAPMQPPPTCTNA